MGGQTSRIPITFIDLQGIGMEGATTEATAGWDLKALSPTLASLSLLSYHSVSISNIFIITSFVTSIFIITVTILASITVANPLPSSSRVQC